MVALDTADEDHAMVEPAGGRSHTVAQGAKALHHATRLADFSVHAVHPRRPRCALTCTAPEADNYMPAPPGSGVP